MPRALYDEAGNPVLEVSDDQNFEEVIERSQKYDQIAKEREELAEKNRELEEAANPNWAQARRKISNLERIAKEKNIEIDAEGNMIENHQFNPEEIKRITEENVKNTMFNSFVEDELENYPEEQREVAKHYFKKLMHGEEQSIPKARQVLQEVNSFVQPVESNSHVNISGGRPPRIEKGNYSESKEGKDLSNRMFNNNSK